jgi:hypothetical protein
LESTTSGCGLIGMERRSMPTVGCSRIQTSCRGLCGRKQPTSSHQTLGEPRVRLRPVNSQVCCIKSSHNSISTRRRMVRTEYGLIGPTRILSTPPPLHPALRISLHSKYYRRSSKSYHPEQACKPGEYYSYQRSGQCANDCTVPKV